MYLSLNAQQRYELLNADTQIQLRYDFAETLDAAQIASLLFEGSHGIDRPDGRGDQTVWGKLWWEYIETRTRDYEEQIRRNFFAAHEED